MRAAEEEVRKKKNFDKSMITKLQQIYDEGEKSHSTLNPHQAVELLKNENKMERENTLKIYY